ncbi:MerR family transcriptional regulator [Paenibacillus sp. GCM10027626]|uniref:helix-turn-helix domain-containing protein n=1 Tax=Paenibacillus sp. GCM10027626 TaxID=3273411 RepID=UPI00363D6BB3
MKTEITISELVKLMNVSVHQIRYFEEKGVLEPAYTDNNQYRMYGVKQIYQLAQILLLRKLGVPVHAIKECMTSFSTDQYRQLLHRSLWEVEAELLRLTDLRQFIKKVLHEQHTFSSQPDQYQIKRKDTTYLARWMEMDMTAKLTAKLLAEQPKRIPYLFESDVHHIFDGSDTIALCAETQAPGDISLPAGDYLCMQRLVEEEHELEPMMEEFCDYAVAQSYVITGPLILIEKSYLSLFSENKLHYELQAMISRTPNSEGGSQS